MLRLEEVHSYYGDSHVVQGVSLAVERGETVALVGRNGAGKTTLLKTIMGIVPRPPRPRAARRRGRDGPADTSDRAAGDHPRPRGPPHLPPAHGGGEPPRGRAGARGGRRRRAGAACSSTSRRLGERLDQAGQNLSGGEQQMLALARGFLTRPALMLIDELSGGLMPMLVDALMDILRRINADGVTILLVEQELDVALALASRCYVLDQGRIQFEGASESLRADHDVQARFLGAT